MRMAHGLFTGICSSTITPWDGSGGVRIDRLHDHIDWLIADGTNAISPLGSSGEFPALEVGQRKRVLDAALEACAGRVPVVAGTHHYSTRLTLELSRHAEQAGADALLIVPPYYMAPWVAQVKDHYRRIAAAVSIPIVLYHNIPLTSVDLNADDLLELFGEGAIGGVKMSNPEPDRICQLLQADDTFPVYVGLDAVAFEGLCHGARGWISGIPSMVPGAARRLYDAICLRSDLAEARRRWRQLAPLMRLQFQAYLSGGAGAHWFSVMNAALNMLGPQVGDPEPPITPLGRSHRAELMRVLHGLGYSVAG